jgi:hypothetical protein
MEHATAAGRAAGSAPIAARRALAGVLAQSIGALPSASIAFRRGLFAHVCEALALQRDVEIGLRPLLATPFT